MNFFDLNYNDALSFFAVLVRFSIVLVVFPMFGNSTVPGPARILLSFVVSVVLYPILVKSGSVDPSLAAQWGASTFGILKVLGTEILFGLVLGFVTRIIFDIILIAGDISGNFMGLAAANQWDPHQESQTQVVAKLMSALAFLIFLAVDGHHIMLKGALNSYEIVGLGQAKLAGGLLEKMVGFTGEALRTGLQLAAPMGVSIFAINIVYGIFARAMPQLNVLILSFSVSALVGLFVLLTSLPEFQSETRNVFMRMSGQMTTAMVEMGK